MNVAIKWQGSAWCYIKQAIMNVTSSEKLYQTYCILCLAPVSAAPVSESSRQTFLSSLRRVLEKQQMKLLET